MKAMISSTALDLPEHRDAVRDSCSRLDIQPIMMDFQGADAGTFLERSYALVDAADIYLIVLGYRYGTVAPGIDKSYTQLEYERARDRGIPILAFLMDDDHPVAARHVDSGADRIRIEGLRQEVSDRYGANYFKNVDHLRAEAINALSNLRLRSPLTRPMPGTRTAPTRPLPFVAHPYTLLDPGQVVGREHDIARIADWFHNGQDGPILVVQGLGGAGKSACIWSWFSSHLPSGAGIDGRVWWSFYEDNARFPSFLLSLIGYLSGKASEVVDQMSVSQQVDEAIALLSHGRHALVLDGLERALRLYSSEEEAFIPDEELDAETANLLTLGGGVGQDPLTRERSNQRRIADPLFAGFLRRLSRIPELRVVISTRLFPADLQDREGRPSPGVSVQQLSRFDDMSAMAIWESVIGNRQYAEELVPLFGSVDNHPLFIRALAIEVRNYRRAPGDFALWRQAHSGFDPVSMDLVQAKTHILGYALRGLTHSDSRVLVEIAASSGSIHYDELEQSLLAEGSAVTTASELDGALVTLEERALVGWDRTANRYDMHPVVRAVVRRMFGRFTADAKGDGDVEGRADSQLRRTPDDGVFAGRSQSDLAGNRPTEGERRELPAVQYHASALEVHVVDGPDAGQVIGLPVGFSQVGRSPSAWLSIADPSMARVALVLDYAADGRIRITAAENSAVAIDGSAVVGTETWEIGSPLKVADSTLMLVRATARTVITERFSSGIVRRTPRLGHRAMKEVPNPADAWVTGQFGGPRLWERAPDDPDFLQIAIGVAKGVDDGIAPPISVSLRSDRLIALVEDSEGPRLANWVLTQIGTYHSPSDVDVTLLAESDGSRVAWLEALPHLGYRRSSGQSGAAFGARACRRKLAELLGRFSADRKDDLRHHLIVIDGWDVLSKMSGVHELIEMAKVDESLTLLILAAELAGLPMATSSAIVVHGQAGELLTRSAVQGFAPIKMATSLAEGIAHCLTGLRDFETPTSTDEVLDAAVTGLAELLNLENSPGNVLESWRSLTSPVAIIGTSLDGPFGLDLAEEGALILVGGTTGSGKSELLRTLIVSLALTSSPNDVTFLLIDYKGGSAFGDLTQLPHVVGMVSDLSPHLARRALVSLTAELRHRERILNEHRVKDFASLKKLDRNALGRLVVVVDEFAALMAEIPELVDGLVNLAVRGRSLGVTTVLATQRPSGVARGSISANARTRIALRTAGEEESINLLGRPDAARISPQTPGRALIRSRSGELLLIQVAMVSPRWVGAREQPADGQIDLLALIRTAAESSNLPPPRRPWMPELAATYDLSRLLTDRTDKRLVFGVADVPENQAQLYAVFEPDRDGNFAVYGTGGAGKSTLLRTLAISAGATERGGPCHVYGLDFATRSLAMLEDLPHVGGIVYGDDEERISQLLSWLRTVIDERAVRYSQVSAATISEYRELAHATDEPRILLLIDGLGAFRQASESRPRQGWFDRFVSIATSGRPVGVHAAFSSETRSAPSAALNAVVQSRVVLRMSTTDDYTMLGVRGDVLDPQCPPGRGIMGEFQVQVATLGNTGYVASQAEAVRSFAKSMRRAHSPAAEPIGRQPRS